MGTIVVIQTFPDERRLMSNLLTEAGHEVCPFYTDSESLTAFSSAITNIQEPFAVVSSQRDMRRRDDIGNFVQEKVSKVLVPTLTIIYARAVGDINFQGLFKEMKQTENHELLFVPKSSFAQSPMDEVSIAERETVKEHIANFFASMALRVR